jgi:hypothetical protein
MTKQEQIKKTLKQHIKIGDKVDVCIKYYKESSTIIGKGKNKKTEIQQVECTKRGQGDVIDILTDKKEGTVYIVNNSDSWPVPHEANFKPAVVKNKDYPYGTNVLKEDWVTKNINNIGANPFKKEAVRVDFLAQSIWQIMGYAGYGKDTETHKPVYTVCTEPKYKNSSYGGVNFDPYVIDENGKVQYYQRGLVWTTEQKQLLIESIYNGIEIGKFIFRHQDWKVIEKEMAENGHGYDYHMVDGKQRMNALIDFWSNKFPDLHGNYYNDLSHDAQHHFMTYNKMAVGVMRENCTDKEVIAAFLTLNFTGAPMSKEHIEFVKTIKI